MTSLKGLTGGFHGRSKGIGGTSGKAHRTTDANISLLDGRILHILKKSSKFRLTLVSVGSRSAVEIGDITLAQLQQASQSGQISIFGMRIAIPNSEKQLEQILR